MSSWEPHHYIFRVMFGYNRIGCLRIPWPLVCQKWVSALPKATDANEVATGPLHTGGTWLGLSDTYGASLRWIISMSARRSRKIPPRV
jgi:hypothetical protein